MDFEEYIRGGRRALVGVLPMEGHLLELTYEGGERRIFDVAPLLKKGGVFADIRPRNRFDSVFLDEDGCVAWDRDPAIDSSIEWNNRIDLCPDSCYMQSTPA